MPLLLSGCGAGILFVKEITGQPYVQMEAVERSDPGRFPWNWPASDSFFKKISDFSKFTGSPTRTYASQEGNTVAVYLYRLEHDMPQTYVYDDKGNLVVINPVYGECDLLEHCYEIRDGLVIKAWATQGDFTGEENDYNIRPQFHGMDKNGNAY